MKVFESCFVCGKVGKTHNCSWACRSCWDSLPQNVRDMCDTGIPDYIPEEQYERYMKEYYEKNN